MKFILQFEKYNPALKIQVTDYVDSKMSSGDVKEIFDIVGEKMPEGVRTDEYEVIATKVREKAIKQLMKFPEQMRVGKGLHINGIPPRSGSGLPNVQNIGGVVPRRV